MANAIQRVLGLLAAQRGNTDPRFERPKAGKGPTCTAELAVDRVVAFAERGEHSLSSHVLAMYQLLPTQLAATSNLCSRIKEILRITSPNCPTETMRY
jgi:hypothetical protein